jgi:hypothetical protein
MLGHGLMKRTTGSNDIWQDNRIFSPFHLTVWWLWDAFGFAAGETEGE